MGTTAFWGTAVLLGTLTCVTLVAQSELAECRQQQVALQALSQEVLDRIQIKQAITADVIEGRLSLRAAAARFAEINASCPTHMTMLRRVYPGLADEEVLCRNVMSFVATELKDQPERAARLLERLEKELPGSSTSERLEGADASAKRR
jgi:hypothetical protein